MRATQRRGIVRDRYSGAEIATAVGFLAPAVVILGVFVIYPIVSSAYLAFTSWNGYGTAQTYVGGQNFLDLFADPQYRSSLLVTVVYAAAVAVFSVITGLGVALLLDAPIRGRSLYRGIFFLPVVTSSIAVAVVWKYMLDPSGIINTLLESMGFGAVPWLQQRWLAVACLTFVTVWKAIGFNALLYLTALQALPRSVFEAASLDGANNWTTVRRITIPLVRPMTFFVVVQALINTFQSFDLAYLLVGRGPGGSAEVLPMMMYRLAFRESQYGYGAAIAYTAFALILGVTIIQWRVSGSGKSDLA